MNEEPVHSTFRLLEALATASRPMSDTAAATLLGLEEPDARDLVLELEQRGFLRRDPSTGYLRLGHRAVGLGIRARGAEALRVHTWPELVALSRALDTSVQLGLYDQGDLLYLAEAHPRTLGPGRERLANLRAPAFCVSPGRMLLAHQPSHEVDRVLGRRLPAYTDHTITDADRLREELSRTRERGYAINRESWRRGVSGVACAVRDHAGAVIGAVAICIEESRFDGRPDGPLVRRLSEATSRLSGHDLSAPSEPLRAVIPA
ncbi:IclR family transcriptional regulator [Egibacter rhizosphaerae]|uniref:IclR family transcriptional regulator n=1 Tax=Egibacter rhizosphaerae TaxID=1670831 RepID=UPI0013F17339|nr:IclR family transcriptional regulator [Egibacter rhizosphaerae]